MTWRREWLMKLVCTEAFQYQIDNQQESFRKERICNPLYNRLYDEGRPVSMESLQRTIRYACKEKRLVRVGKGRYCHPAFYDSSEFESVTTKTNGGI